MASGVEQRSGREVSRRTWDREEAERKYEERLAREKSEAKEAKNKKAGMGKIPPPAATDSNSVQARTEAVIKVEELRGKRELVTPLYGLGNKGKTAGFYCEACDLTYKDSISYLDHLNSAQRKFPPLECIILLMSRSQKGGNHREG